MIFLRFNKDLAAHGYAYHALLLPATITAWMSQSSHRPTAEKSRAHTGALQAPTSLEVATRLPSSSSGLHLPGKFRMFSFPANSPPEPESTTNPSKIQQTSPNPWVAVTRTN